MSCRIYLRCQVFLTRCGAEENVFGRLSPRALKEPVGTVANRAHWPTKENCQKFIFFRFFRPTQKIAWGGPKWGREGFFFRLIQTLPTFWATWIWNLRISMFEIFVGFQIFGFPGSQLSKSWSGPGLGRAGPGLSQLDQKMLIFYCEY